MEAFNCYQLNTFNQHKNLSRFLSSEETPGEKLPQGPGAAQATVLFHVQKEAAGGLGGRAESSPEEERVPGS